MRDECARSVIGGDRGGGFESAVRQVGGRRGRGDGVVIGRPGRWVGEGLGGMRGGVWGWDIEVQ
jgi:hypothetical protein